MMIHILKKIACGTLLFFATTRVSAQDIFSEEGTLTVSKENTDNANENSGKLIDNKTDTKYLIFDFPKIKPLWFQFAAKKPVVAGLYTLTSANDAPDRDPKNWELQGSADGKVWTPLDTRKDEAFDQRLQTKTYTFQNATAYAYYRLFISENNGGSLFQLSEWHLFQANAPEPPTELAAIAPSGKEVYVTWKDNSSTETGFEIETSTDGTTFTLAETAEANTAAFTLSGLAVATKYYFRVKATNTFGNSEPSNSVEATTLDFEEPLVDLTNNGGTLSVQQEGTFAGEESPKIIDNDTKSKFLLRMASFWVQYASTDKAILTKYTLTSANDAPDRDPKNWTLEGSNNGTDWAPLDTRSNQTFTARAQTKTYVFQNTKAFSFYKLTITNNGSDLSQTAEWELWGEKLEVPAGPGNLTVKALSETEINITWKDNSINETGFEIERSTDGTTFTAIASVGENSASYTDTKLEPGGGYYYRVSAIGVAGASVYSNIAATRTKGGNTAKPQPQGQKILSPNGDNVNDVWVIKNLEHYPINEVKIFDRAGRLVYSKENYTNTWDGTTNGSPLTEDAYFFIVKFWPGIPELRGSFMLVREK